MKITWLDAKSFTNGLKFQRAMLNARLAAEPEKSASTTVNHGIGDSSPHAGSVMGKATSKKNGLKNLTKRIISTGKKVNSRCAGESRWGAGKPGGMSHY